MDRALNLQVITEAVGSHPRLPAPAALRRLLANTEVSLFTQQASIDDQVLDTGWYLQAVATARPDLALYDLPRQRLAHQVSGHIFDLALQTTDLTDTERLRYTFASQVGYLGGDLTPNAAAVARGAPVSDPPYPWSTPGAVSLEAGVVLLALDRRALYPLLRARRSQLRGLAARSDALGDTPYAAVDAVIRGIQALTDYLTYGRAAQLETAQRAFTVAVSALPAEDDVDSRWVAAHLLRIAGQLATTSVWAVLPPDLPAAARAMTLGDPPVMALWPPQLEFLAGTDGGPAPLSPDSRRLLLSFPTSAGKTLLAQILIAVHVAASDSGDVCVVAPTHSLCRELSESLDRRLRTLGRQLFIEGPLGFDRPKPAAARVTVMTPEKLAALLRADPEGLLDQYAMFVIDEAHLVADPSRGWRLEETLTALHHMTINRAHRIVVLSAAIGNQVHVIDWISADGSRAAHKHTDWRGPRRLTAIYSGVAKWNDEVVEPAQGTRLSRRHVPITGVVHLRTGDDVVRGTFTEPVGSLVLRQKRDGGWTRDSQASSTERARLVPLVNHVAASGLVLVIQPTRLEAQRLAEEVAASIDEEGEGTFVLAELARARLGEAHPLTKVVRKGIAFHHAALPVDMQAEIESAARAGQIRILVATSTLIEGINLPFKTVIVGRRGYSDAEGNDIELLAAPDLLNAVGRAGRAGRETEGWMILAEQSSDYTESMFVPLEQTGDDLEIVSTLATLVALEALETFERQARTSADAVFQSYGASTDGFLSFVWFVAEMLRESSQDEASSVEIMAVVERTLAWQQLDSAGRQTLERAVEAALAAYRLQPASERARWARSGTSLPTAKTLESLAERLHARLRDVDITEGSDDLASMIGLILDAETLNILLSLGENERRGFKAYRTAPRDQQVPVDIRTLLLDWVSGIEIQELADSHLSSIDDEGYRYEALAEFSASAFEHHVPWTLGVLTQWVNARLDESGSDFRIPDVLPAAIHYGVHRVSGVELMVAGVRSRRLANSVSQADATRTDRDELPLRAWLAEMTIDDWRRLFDASPTETADLLGFVRAPGASVVSTVLEGNAHQLELNPGEAEVTGASAASLHVDSGDPAPAPIRALVDHQLVGTVRPADHAEVSLLMNLGVPLQTEVMPGEFGPVLAVSLARETDDDDA